MKYMKGIQLKAKDFKIVGGMMCQNPTDDTSKKVCLDVLNFYGKLNLIESLNWIMSMEDYFNGHEMPDNKRWYLWKLSWTKMLDYGGTTWKSSFMGWANLQLTCGKTCNWRWTKTSFPSEYEKIFLLKQASRSVEEYFDEFLDLSIRNCMHETYAQKSTRYKARPRSDLWLEMQKSRSVVSRKSICCPKIRGKHEWSTFQEGGLSTRGFPSSLSSSSAPQESQHIL